MIKLGMKIDERYRLTSFIGTGGMAEVYEATDIISRNSVAIKILKEEIMNDKENLVRFKNEMVFSASFDHPNIVRVFNYGEIENRPYIVYEYVKGQTIRSRLDFNTKASMLVGCTIMLQLTDAIEYIHEHGILHRDIKPENLFYMPDGSVKIGDFGIAIRKSDINKEDTNAVLGSVHYLAPEISKGYKASVQSDIYSLGVTFFELITGRLPYEGNDPVEIAIAHIKHPFPNPQSVNPDISNEINNIIIKATSKDPKNRFTSAKEMHDAIQNALDNKDNFISEKKGFFARLFGFKK